MQIACACGAIADHIEGDNTQGPNGELVQRWVCGAGHQFGVIPSRIRQCPKCHHAWAEAVQGGAPSYERLAHGQSPNHGVRGIEDLGFDAVMRYTDG